MRLCEKIIDWLESKKKHHGGERFCVYAKGLEFIILIFQLFH